MRVLNGPSAVSGNLTRHGDGLDVYDQGSQGQSTKGGEEGESEMKLKLRYKS
jgi:hypothetical protein